MSDISQGPGWWVASDGKRYPLQSTPPPPPSVGASQSSPEAEVQAGSHATEPVEANATLTCPNGHPVEADDLFCDRCGITLATATDAAVPTTAPTCPNGHLVEADDFFCDTCGTSLLNPAGWSAAPPATGKTPLGLATRSADEQSKEDDKASLTEPVSNQELDSGDDGWRYRFCPNCGTEGISGASFCGECGEPLSAVASTSKEQDTPTIRSTTQTTIPAAAVDPKAGISSDSCDNGPAQQESGPNSSKTRLTQHPHQFAVVALALVLIIGAAIGLLVSHSGSSGITLHGQLTAYERTPGQQGNACIAKGRYSRYRAGSPIRVESRSGHVLASGALATGVLEPSQDNPHRYNCVFAYDISGIPKITTYRLDIVAVGILVVTYVQLESVSWTLTTASVATITDGYGFSGDTGVTGTTGNSGSGVTGQTGNSGTTGSGNSGGSFNTGTTGDGGFSGDTGDSGSGDTGSTGGGISGDTGDSGGGGYTGDSGGGGYTGDSGGGGYTGDSGGGGYTGDSGGGGYAGDSGGGGYTGDSGGGGFTGGT